MVRKRTPLEIKKNYLIERKAALNKEWDELRSSLPLVYYQTLAVKMHELNQIDSDLIENNLREYLG